MRNLVIFISLRLCRCGISSAMVFWLQNFSPCCVKFLGFLIYRNTFSQVCRGIKYMTQLSFISKIVCNFSLFLKRQRKTPLWILCILSVNKFSTFGQFFRLMYLDIKELLNFKRLWIPHLISCVYSYDTSYFDFRDCIYNLWNCQFWM